jgi:hypothetical protein
MTTNEISRRDLDQEKSFAIAMAQSDLLPPAYRGKAANVLVALEWAHALGVAPMTAMQQLHIIEGKPMASAQMIGGLVRRAGHNLRVAGDDKRAVCEITRSDDPDFVFKSEWTIERAQRAGLTNKGTWKQYPGSMLKARAITEAARDACPEALLGVAYTAEEIEPHRPAQARVDTTRVMPKAAPKPEPEVVEAAEVVTDAPGVLVDEDGVMYEIADSPVVTDSDELSY